MTSTTVSPFVVSDVEVVELADGKGGKRRLWKKQILPAGTRKYEGQELDFAQINPAVVKSFEDKAFDTVPFVMSLVDNKHPQPGQEADQLEGDLEKLELAQDGSLYGFFDLSNSPRVQDLIKKSNRKFGVSGRIEVDYVAKDTDRKFPYALSHVCGTLRPHLKGMAPWESVDLGEVDEEREVIDFSGEVIDEPTTETKETGDDLVAVELPKEKVDKLMAFLADLEKIENAVDDKEEDDKVVELPQAVKDQIAAAEAQGRQALELAERMQVSAATERWGAQRAVLLGEGVPPAILDLAGKVLGRHRPITLEFAEGDTVDATSIVRDILDECKGYLTLGDERGHQFSDSRDTKKNAEYDALEEAFGAQWTHDGRNR